MCHTLGSSSSATMGTISHPWSCYVRPSGFSRRQRWTLLCSLDKQTPPEIALRDSVLYCSVAAMDISHLLVHVPGMEPSCLGNEIILLVKFLPVRLRHDQKPLLAARPAQRVTHSRRVRLGKSQLGQRVRRRAWSGRKMQKQDSK